MRLLREATNLKTIKLRSLCIQVLQAIEETLHFTTYPVSCLSYWTFLIWNVVVFQENYKIVKMWLSPQPEFWLQTFTWDVTKLQIVFRQRRYVSELPSLTLISCLDLESVLDYSSQKFILHLLSENNHHHEEDQTTNLLEESMMSSQGWLTWGVLNKKNFLIKILSMFAL